VEYALGTTTGRLPATLFSEDVVQGFANMGAFSCPCANSFAGKAGVNVIDGDCADAFE